MHIVIKGEGMKITNTLNKIFPIGCMFIFTILFIIKPEICKGGVSSAIILCTQVVIPALFPFTVCVLFIMKTGVLEKLKFLQPLANWLFGLPSQLFAVMLLSFVGGYPIGAKLINDLIREKKISASDGRRMLNFCVNAGPAFIIAAVGSGILNSKTLGYILLVSHVGSSLTICILSRFSKSKIKIFDSLPSKTISAADNFVASAAEGAKVILNICSFVIFFAGITAYIDFYSSRLPAIKPLLFLTEVTSAVAKTKNVYLISFLLGFAGISIWCQIMTVGKAIKINFLSFILFRIIHGLLSLGFTAVLVKMFNVSLPAFSNTNNLKTLTFSSGMHLSLSLLVMGIVFIISLSDNKRDRKILEDFI